MNQIIKFMNDNSCEFKWENGDFIILDNTVSYHSR